MTMNLNTSASIDAVLAAMPSEGDQTFSTITSLTDFDTELQKGSNFSALLDNVVATGHSVTYHAIASAVHVAHAVKSDSKFRKALEDRAKTLNIEYAGDNAFGLVTRVMFGGLVTVPGALGTSSSKWVPNRTLTNKDRHVRYFVENGVLAHDVVATIMAAEETVGKDKITKLDAIACRDLKAHPPTAAQQVARTWGSAAVQTAVKVQPVIASVAIPKITFNKEGYALVVARKAANGDAEILFDAVLSEKTIQMGVRKGYAAK